MINLLEFLSRIIIAGCKCNVELAEHLLLQANCCEIQKKSKQFDARGLNLLPKDRYKKD